HRAAQAEADGRGDRLVLATPARPPRHRGGRSRFRACARRVTVNRARRSKGDRDMERRDVTAQILDAKRRKGLSFTQIAEQVGADRVWLTAALLGQHAIPTEQAQAVAALLGLSDE